MFFGLSKLFWSLAQPLNALCLLALAGMLMGLRWKRAGQGVMNAALVLILLFGILPVGPVLVTWLENRYPAPKTLPAKIDGIIVLGGAFESYLSEATGQIVANDQVDRVFCFMDIAQKHPEAKLVWSGGPGDIVNPGAMEGNDARAFFKLTGFDRREILYEEKSRNTYENAVYTKDMVRPKPDETWVVTTSAYHMPRSVGIFEKVGWKIIPYECDRKTDGHYNMFDRLPNVAGNYNHLNIAVKELIGLVAYYLTGKSAFIIPPGPLPSSHEQSAQ